MDNKSINKSQDTLILKNIQEIGKWINYLGDYRYFELAEPIKDQQKKILVQKGKVLRKSIYDNLQSRKISELPSAFVFKYSKELIEQCKKKVSKALYKCLEPGQFHIAPQLMKITKKNYTKVGDILFENKNLLDLFVMLDMESDPLLQHLGEIAIVCTGITDLFCIVKEKSSAGSEMLKSAFLAGLLHDLSLKGHHNYLSDDLQNFKENGHAEKSKTYVEQNFEDITSIIPKIIGLHHRTRPIWDTDEEILLTKDRILSECLCFSEYLFIQFRMPSLLKEQKIEVENALEKIFFNIGQTIGQGYYHRTFLKLIAKIQEKFASIMKYGLEIGELEKKCQFRRSAVSYPIPKCTQILCRKKIEDCDQISLSFSINIVTSTKTMGWIGADLLPGKYPKCKLSENLPKHPEELDGIS
jgi:hypothetical protein